ncbi:hypothetical protein ASD65_11415 [Microbacterium sp. Root61]|uniref:DUF3180 domain-containing protein n=1 Tax=Microbacterium sp. Root61 TaxID=1736570 RepID=UPI0006F77295|nr:DUF3180 domain-containing protein [Microbacterium sp. Root61]KRA24967.1 hypothetical protein ASD65_11415 [Microbacterium sp. Root61]
MKRTGAGILLIAALIGGGAGFLLDLALTAGGRATFTPAVTLPILLALLALLVIALAIPIRRATRGRSPQPPVNPFRALRVAMLAKASSIVGAVVGGFAVGLALYLLTRPVSPSVGSLSAIIATAVCGAILVAAGLVAEHLCTIRKDDDDEQPGGHA